MEHPHAILVAGATDVGLWVTKQFRRLPLVCFVSQVPELQTIKTSRKAMEFGAAATLDRVREAVAERHPSFAELLRRFGSEQVRSSATIGGNIANGSPIGDCAPALIALGAELKLRRGADRRIVKLEHFFVDYGVQDLAEGEFVESVLVPKQADRLKCYKLSKRFDQDISAVCGCINLRVAGGRVTKARIAYGGMAAIPKRARETERALENAAWDQVRVEAAMNAMEDDFAPMSDMRASARYRMEAAKNMLLRYFLEDTNEANSLQVLEGADMTLVGAAVCHDAALLHVTGGATYVDDIPAPRGTLHLAFGLSEIAHGRIRRMDLSQVRAAPSVVAVITSEDLPGANDVSPVPAREPLLAEGTVHFAGQPLFIVVAESAPRRAGSSAQGRN